MLGFANMLRAMVGSGQEMSYSKRLCELTSVLVDTVEAAKTVGKRQKVGPSLDYLSRPADKHDDLDGYRESGQAEAPAEARHFVLHRGAMRLGALEFSISDWDEYGAGALTTPANFGHKTNDYCGQVDDEASTRGDLATWIP